MSITSVEEAEELASKWLKSKYRGKLAKHRFSQVMLENGVWLLKAQIELNTGVLKTEPRSFSMNLEADTGKVLGYKEG